MFRLESGWNIERGSFTMPAGDRPFPIPNLAQARQKSSMAHQILVKLKEQGLEENYDEDLAKLCTDLGDLWSSQLVFTERLGDFLDIEIAQDDTWNKFGDCLADLCSELEHMAWHIQSVKDPIERIAQRSYSADDQNPS